MIDRFIQRVQKRLILQHVLPLIVIPLGLYVFYRLAQATIDAFNFPLTLSFPLYSLLIGSLLGIALYLVWTVENVMPRAVCRHIDDKAARPDDRALLQNYWQGKRETPPPLGYESLVLRIKQRLEENYYGDARKLAPLLPPHFWKRLLLGCLLLLLFWLLSMLLASFIFSQPLWSDPFGKDTPSRLEEAAKQTQQECKNGAAQKTAAGVKEAAAKNRTGGLSESEKQENLKQQRDAVQKNIDQLGGGKLNTAIDEAAQVLSENRDTAPAGKALYRKNLTQAAEELLLAEEKAIQDDDRGRAGEMEAALKAAARKFEDGQFKNVAEQLQNLAEATEQQRALSEAQKQDFEKAFKELDDQLHDINALRNLKDYIEAEIRQANAADSTERKLDRAITQIDSTLATQALKLRLLGGKCNPLSDELQQINKELKRRVVSAEEVLKKLEEMDEKLKNLAQQAGDDNSQQEIQEIQQTLQKTREQFNYDLLEHLKTLYARGRVAADDFKEVVLNPGQDASKRSEPPPENLGPITKPQVGDSRVVRPQNSPKDREIFKELNEHRKN